MTTKRFNIILAAFLLLFSVIFAKSAAMITAPADVYPKAVIAMIAVLAVLLLLQTIFVRKEEKEAYPFAGMKVTRSICTMVCTFLYYLGIRVLGFYASSFLFLIGLIVLLDRHKQKGWKNYAFLLLLCLAIMLIIYLGFHIFLRVPTPAGWLF